MAQATAATMAAERRAAALALARAQIQADKARDAGNPEPPVSDESEDVETPVRDEPGHSEPSVKVEAATVSPEPPDHDEDDVPDPDIRETPEDEEDDAEDQETPVSTDRAVIEARTARQRVQALLAEALRLGEAHHLLERQPDGSILLAGQTRTTRRATSDCTCQTCSPHDQRHWWCVVCSSGPHDWLMNKPQFERQTLKPGGIEGARQAACSAQCAREFMASLGRQPSGVQVAPTIDPTLALP